MTLNKFLAGLLSTLIAFPAPLLAAPSKTRVKECKNAAGLMASDPVDVSATADRAGNGPMSLKYWAYDYCVGTRKDLPPAARVADLGGQTIAEILSRQKRMKELRQLGALDGVAPISRTPPAQDAAQRPNVSWELGNDGHLMVTRPGREAFPLLADPRTGNFEIQLDGGQIITVDSQGKAIDLGTLNTSIDVTEPAPPSTNAPRRPPSTGNALMDRGADVAGGLIGSLVGAKIAGKDGSPLRQILGAGISTVTGQIASNAAKIIISHFFTHAAAHAAAQTGAQAGALGGLFSMSPTTLGITAAIAAVTIIIANWGHGRKTADAFVKQYQNPFGEQLGKLHDAFYSAVREGSMSRAEGMVARSAVAQLWQSFKDDAESFAKQGKTQRKVVDQAYDTLNGGQMGGHFMDRLLAGMDDAIAKYLKFAAPEVELTRPYDGQTLHGVRNLEATVLFSEGQVEKIEFLLIPADADENDADKVVVLGTHARSGTAKLTHWGMEWGTDSEQNGDYIVVARATNSDGVAGAAYASITIENAVAPAPTPSPTPTPPQNPTPTPTPTAVTALKIPSVPVVRLPASFSGDKQWLESWGKSIGGRADLSRGERNAEPCGVRWGNEPNCRIQAGGRWYTYPIASWYPFVENIYWQLVARGEIRGNDSAHTDEIQTEGPTVFAYNTATATLLRYNELPPVGAYAPLMSYLSTWPAGAGLDPKAAQADILHNPVFLQALERQFFYQYPQYVNLRGKPLSAWPADALHAREHAIPDLYFTLTSRRLKQNEYVAMVAADVAAGKLPAGFKSYLETAAATSHGECSPSGACTFRQSALPNSPEYVCMDVGKTGRFTLQPKDQQPPCGAANVGQLSVFPRSCGWDPAVCTGVGSSPWKFLPEVKAYLADRPTVYGQVAAALRAQGFDLDDTAASTGRGGRTPDGTPTGTAGPRLSVSKPRDGETVSGEIDFQAGVSPGGADLRRVELRVDGKMIGASAVSGNVSLSHRMDTTRMKDGAYKVQLTAVDKNFDTANVSLTMKVANGAKSAGTDASTEAMLKKLASWNTDDTLLAVVETAAPGGACSENGDCMTPAAGGGRLVCMHDGDRGWRWQPEKVQPPCTPDPGSRCRVVEFAASCSEGWSPARCYPGSDSRDSGDNRVGHWRFLTEDPPSPDPCAGE